MTAAVGTRELVVRQQVAQTFDQGHVAGLLVDVAKHHQPDVPAIAQLNHQCRQKTHHIKGRHRVIVKGHMQQRQHVDAAEIQQRRAGIGRHGHHADAGHTHHDGDDQQVMGVVVASPAKPHSTAPHRTRQPCQANLHVAPFFGISIVSKGLPATQARPDDGHFNSHHHHAPRHRSLPACSQPQHPHQQGHPGQRTDGPHDRTLVERPQPIRLRRLQDAGFVQFNGQGGIVTACHRPDCLWIDMFLCAKSHAGVTASHASQG